MWHMGEGTGSAKPGQGETCFPNTPPAAGTAAERVPGINKWQRQKKELRKETLGKHVRQRWGERRRPRRQMEGTKA